MLAKFRGGTASDSDNFRPYGMYILLLILLSVTLYSAGLTNGNAKTSVMSNTRQLHCIHQVHNVLYQAPSTSTQTVRMVVGVIHVYLIAVSVGRTVKVRWHVFIVSACMYVSHPCSDRDVCECVEHSQ